MSHLADYIEQKNSWNRIFGGTVINVRNLDHAIAQQLADNLACDLSPENLTCDGELDRHTVQQRAARYRGALRELQQRFNVEVELY